MLRMILGTRKGVQIYGFDGQWRMESEAYVGDPVSYAFYDDRNDTLWAAPSHEHWGPKLVRSRDRGASWEEVPTPAYPEETGAKLTYQWVIQPGPKSKPDRLYMGTCPGGLFITNDGGDNWSLSPGQWAQKEKDGKHWFGGGRDDPGIHSVVVDEANPDHLYIGVSCAGVYETYDGGETWAAKNKGLLAEFLPDPHAELGHDPHLLVAAPSDPSRMWQQNHCGIFRSDDSGASWSRVSTPGDAAHFGFPICVDANDPDVAYVAPAKSDEVRVAYERGICVARTRDGGQSWQTLSNGLPQQGAYDIVYRHALDLKGDHLAFGSTTGNAFYSTDGGENWTCLSNYLPPIYSVRFAEW